MKKNRKYKTRVRHVEAIQYAGGNKRQISKFLADVPHKFVRKMSRIGPRVCIPGLSAAIGWKYHANVGDWILRLYPNVTPVAHIVRILTDEEFQKEYEPDVEA